MAGLPAPSPTRPAGAAAWSRRACLGAAASLGTLALAGCSRGVTPPPATPVAERGFADWQAQLDAAERQRADARARLQTPRTTREQRLRRLRAALQPHWGGAESGNVWLGPEHVPADGWDMAEVDALLADSLNPPAPPWPHPVPEAARQPFLALLDADLAHFFASATLAPGVYALRNHHRAEWPQGYLLSADNPRLLPLPPTERFDFALRAEHLALVRAMAMPSERGFPELNGDKRPYRDGRFYRDSIRAVLASLPSIGARAASPSDADIDRLHGETLFAVQALWTHAPWPPVVRRAATQDAP